LLPLLYAGGGVFGTVLRYLTTVATAKLSLTFPYGTLVANLLGCFIIGVVVEMTADSNIVSTEARIFLATSLCGGFTTLSSVVYELAEMLRDGELLFGSVYFVATFAGALVCSYIGTLTVGLLLK
jgi:fluoride exporter